jgi:hypothetical protein
VNLRTAFHRGIACYRWDDIFSDYNGHQARFRIFADAARVDGIRLSCSAREAQQCADLCGGLLPTPRLLDLRHAQAQRKIEPAPKHYAGGRGMMSAAAVKAHSERIDQQDGRLSGILSPVGKHWVLHERGTAARAVLYGWHLPSLAPWRGIRAYPTVSLPGVGVIQPVSTAHDYGHHDYSMTLVLVADFCIVDGAKVRTSEVYTDPDLCGLVVASGRPLRAARLPGVPVEVPPAHPSQEGSMREESADFVEGIETPENLGLAVLELARQDVGVREQPPGSNRGPRVEEYLGEFGVPAPAHWCASALGFWLRRACEWLELPRPIQGSAGAQATAGQFKAAGRWVGPGPGLLAALRPGNVVVWRRGPPGGWQGHIGIVDSQPIGQRFGTVEGNSGPRGETVARMVRSTTDARLLGVGILDTIEAPYTPTHAELEEAGRLMALGADVMRGEDADPLAGFED